MSQATSSVSSPNRRDFLTTSTAVASAGLLLPVLAPQVHAAGSDTLRIGLIGCGGRGSGAIAQALRADPNVKLVAMGDAFADRLKKCLDDLRGDEALAKKVAVKEDHCFVGFDAYKGVIGSGVDVVLLCTPPHFRAAHLQAAVEAGKHIFAEKPVAVDAPGVRSVMESCRKAKKKDLAVVSGLCYRYERGKRETMKRVHDGAIGDIIAMHTNYNAGRLWSNPRQQGWTDMEWQTAQLALFHLAVGRSHRRAAHSQPGQDGLGDEGRAAAQGQRHRRPAGAD